MLEKQIVNTVGKLRLASQNMPKIWDGRKSILEMTDAGFKQWKQIEWLDSYFKFLCQKHFEGVIDMPGRKYGNMRFDGFSEISWDFKVQAANTTTYNIIANQAEAIADTINDYSYYGMILAIGEVEYNDQEKTFKKWQNQLTLKQYQYDTNRINKGAMSRYYKIGFLLSEIHFICLNSKTLNQCSALFQTGFGNANSNSRRTKIMIDIRNISNAALVATEIFYGKIPLNEVFKAERTTKLSTSAS